MLSRFSFVRRAFPVAMVALSLQSMFAQADDEPAVLLDDYLVETRTATLHQKAPAVTQQLLALDLQGQNLATTAEALRNLPNIFIRERFIGDKNSPLGIRGTSNRQTGRTLVFADGVLLSNFLGTGFGNSPRWFLLSPEEIAKVAVIYGPFSALYAGNSLGGTVLFSTAMPTQFTATAKGQYFTHHFKEFGTNENLHGTSAFLSVGDRIGKLGYYAFYNHLDNDSASTQFWTINRSVTDLPGSGGTRATGALTDTDFSGNDRIIFGAEGPTEAMHDLFKLKLDYAFAPYLHLRYTGAYWINQENRTAPETYLRDGNGAEVWAGRIEAAGRTFTVAPSTFGLSEREQSDMVHAVTFASQPDDGLQVIVIGSLYDALKDTQLSSTGALPATRVAGAGLSTVAGRTGWKTGEIQLGYRPDRTGGITHAPIVGYHYDTFFTVSNQYNLANWREASSRTSLNNRNGGTSRTHALYVQDTWRFASAWTLTPGLRWEKWDATDGFREKDFTGTRVRTRYADRGADGFSPKLALAWAPSRVWQARLSFGEAYRFPTVGELFQGSISANGSVTNSDPNLRAERALDKDFTIERTLRKNGRIRLSLFEEDVRRALISQSVILPDGTSFTGTQNVGRIRTRGVEFVYTQKKLFADVVDFTTAVSYTDARILENSNLPSSVGRQVPRIPYWQSRTGLSWRPWTSLTIAAQIRTSSHQFNTLDNSDPYGGYGGTDDYTVIDIKATLSLAKRTTVSLGADNIGDFRYHVFHPMEERTYFLEVTKTW
jgi:iron complex outermembrane receptor protein